AGTPMPLAHDVQLLFETEFARVLRVPAIHAVNEGAHPPLRRAQHRDHAGGLDVDLGDLLAPAQIFDGGGPGLAGNPERNAAPRPAAIKPEYEARFLRGPAVNEGIDAQRAM